jgi:FtsP/CotA-like multicopper oxidase with cupredoxin domain
MEPQNAEASADTETLQWRQLAQDGVQLADLNYQASLNKPFYMAPANRVDILVKAPLIPAGEKRTFRVRVQNIMARSQVKPTPKNPNAKDPIPGTVLLTVDLEGPPVMRNGRPEAMAFLSRAPAQPAFLRDITEKELVENNSITRTLEFNSEQPRNERQHTINGIQFGEKHSHVSILLGRTEEWTIKNRTARRNPVEQKLIDHPLHIHINPFQVSEFFDPNEKLIDPKTGRLEGRVEEGVTQAVDRYVFDKDTLVSANNPFRNRQCYIDPNNPNTWSVSGARTAAGKACEPQDPLSKHVWRDVFAIPSARMDFSGEEVTIPGYFKMRSRFVDYAGLYVLHCHILIHEDRGMMFSVEVLRADPAPLVSDSPARHHH